VEEPSSEFSEVISLCTEPRDNITGTSHSRGGEQADGFIESIEDIRGLYGEEKVFQQNDKEIQIPPNDRFVCKQRQHVGERLLCSQTSGSESYGGLQRECFGFTLVHPPSLATSSYSINNESVTQMPERQDRESDDFGPELEGTTMHTAVEQFVFKEGNNRGSGENSLDWTIHEEQGIMFATRDMALHLIGMRCLLRPQKSQFKYTSVIV
jgi:hypothetical protein